MLNVFRTKGTCWSFRYVDYVGVRRIGTGTTSKQETEELARRVQAQHNAIRKDRAPAPLRIPRSLSISELQSLLRVSEPKHRLTYLVAATTGLRKAELRAVRRRHLDPVRKGLLLDGTWTKNRRSCFQSMPSAIFDQVSAAARSCGPDDAILHVHHDTRGMIAADLARAGIPRVTGEGVLDFNSLRVTHVMLVINALSSARGGTIPCIDKRGGCSSRKKGYRCIWKEKIATCQRTNGRKKNQKDRRLPATSIARMLSLMPGICQICCSATRRAGGTE